MRSETRLLLGTLVLAPIAAFGPHFVDQMSTMQTFRISEVDVTGTHVERIGGRAPVLLPDFLVGRRHDGGLRHRR